jgi:hypothetical protein
MDEYVIAEKIFKVEKIWIDSSQHARTLAAQFDFKQT